MTAMICPCRFGVDCSHYDERKKSHSHVIYGDRCGTCGADLWKAVVQVSDVVKGGHWSSE